MIDLDIIGKKAQKAYKDSIILRSLKDKALLKVADSIISNTDKIINENMIDLNRCKDQGLNDVLIDRLMLNEKRISEMAQSVREVAAMHDPIGSIVSGYETKEGLKIIKVRVPLGVIGLIYESRPNVTVDSAALCLKSGNCIILKGGKEAINSNIILAEIMRQAISEAGLPKDCIQLIDDTSRETTNKFMQLTDYLDVLIPRGGRGLINAVVENSRVPVIKTGEGNCHIYVDKYADVNMAKEIIFNAKTQRPSVCNAAETILVHKDIANTALKEIKSRLDEKNVEIRGCKRTIEILGPDIIRATQEDYYKEYLDYIVAVKVVLDIDEAIEHIRKYSTGHSECIITNDYNNADKFTTYVDSAAVYVNASTRFTDGGKFLLGAEIGISTQKLHARGPMGINELTTTKYIVRGSGQVR